MAKKLNRCSWCGTNELYINYHDNEWGKPVYENQKLFALLCLEGAQAGLSWITILQKRENYYKAFDNFDPEKIALYDNSKVEELMQNASIVRNRLKINSVITNAKAYLQIQKKQTFNSYLWEFVNNSPIVNYPETEHDIPAKTTLSEQISKQLKQKGFKFVGPTIIYAFMQAVGMVNDHICSCNFK